MSHIVVAPFSNSDIRDWPLESFGQMIELMLPRLAPTTHVHVVGTPNQKLRGCEVVRKLPADRVTNDCGRFSWAELLVLLQSADCVVGNNSGIGHLAGHYRVPTVCIFGGSHQRHEWRPLGDTVIMLSRVIGCSPCQLDHGGYSPYQKACLREISPAVVVDAAFEIMRRTERRAA